MATKIYAWESGSNSGVNTWTVPSDWNSANNKIEVIGRGGKCPTTQRYSGAGGGAYAKNINVTLTPGSTIYFGEETTGTLGVWVNFSSNVKPTSSTEGVFAESGQDTQGNTTPGVGGSSANSIGQTTFSGGTGGVSSFSVSAGSGGGGAAGPGGAGKNGGDGDSAAAGEDCGGGGGGAGGGSSTAGGAGSTTGGAGGLGPSGTAGGAGALLPGAAGGVGSNGSGGGGGGTNSTGGQGGDGTDIGTVTHQSTGGIAVGISVGSGGGGGGAGPTFVGANGGKYGAGSGGSGVSAGPVLPLNPGLIAITYEATETATATSNMFMLF